MPEEEHFLDVLKGVLVAIRPAAGAVPIGADSSLTGDLGLGSLDLVELATRLREEHGAGDLTPWLAQALEPGGDTVGSLAGFLARSARSARAATPVER